MEWKRSPLLRVEGKSRAHGEDDPVRLVPGRSTIMNCSLCKWRPRSRRRKIRIPNNENFRTFSSNAPKLGFQVWPTGFSTCTSGSLFFVSRPLAQRMFVQHLRSWTGFFFHSCIWTSIIGINNARTRYIYKNFIPTKEFLTFLNHRISNTSKYVPNLMISLTNLIFTGIFGVEHRKLHNRIFAIKKYPSSRVKCLFSVRNCLQVHSSWKRILRVSELELRIFYVSS